MVAPPLKEAVPVVTKDPPMVAPPRRERVAVATEPRFVTVRSVSLSVLAGQFVPLERQTV